LIRVVAFASLNGREIDIPLVDQVLKDLATPEKDALNISIDMIKKLTAEYYGVRVEDLSAKIRTEKIAGARQMAMYLARELTKASLPKIGEEFGGRDHTTVMHACEKIRTSAKANATVADGIRNISATIKKFTPQAV